MIDRQFGPWTKGKEKEQVRKPLSLCTQPRAA